MMYKTFSIIIIVIIFIVGLSVYNQLIYYMIDKTNYELTDVSDIKFRTGDIIMHKYNSNILTYDNVNKKTNITLGNINYYFFQTGFLMNFSPKYYPYIHMSMIFMLD